MPSGEVAAGAADVSVIGDINDQTFTVRNNTCETPTYALRPRQSRDRPQDQSSEFRLSNARERDSRRQFGAPSPVEDSAFDELRRWTIG